ncbi:MAG: toll/interleukin-1 receptor domain-containing protein [Candidatus Aerophobetes bacterium]|nr:toll/interleukin-1 receptor domain-containing protein [Candidatus Aerophobetes bacterium]
MAYKVFISHSTRDRGLVIALANLLTRFGVEVFVAEWYLSPGEPLGKKVFIQIEKADCVVVLLTKNGVRSKWVQQEIGYALKTSRPLIPLVEKGTPSSDLGALQGREYIKYDPFQPKEALTQASTYVKSLKLRKEEQEKTSLVVGAILTLLLFLLLSGGKE